MKRKQLIGAAAFLLAVIIPLAAFLLMTLPLDDTYSETFVAELSHKFDRLTSIDEPKVIVIGGSSAAFGIDSEALEEHLGMPVVNFGLYATLGTKLMMDLSKANIGEGDIIILSPEMNAQTLSLYFNAKTTWQAMEGDAKMLRYIAPSDLSAMAGAYYDYGITKLQYKKDGIRLSPSGVYRRDSFDEYGDISYERPKNVLNGSTGLAYDTTNMIDLDKSIVSDEFIDYVNEYTAWCEKRGATVYFSFCPMNEEAFVMECDSEARIAFFDYLARALSCKVINSPFETTYASGYFYDTNFHLNDAGVTAHTKSLLSAIYRERGQVTLPAVTVLEVPREERYVRELGKDGNEYAEYFVFERYGNGYAIIGTTDAAKEQAYLELPSSYSGREVLALGEGAFAGCKKLTELKIYSSITVFMEEAFAGLEGTVKVYMDVDDAPYMTDSGKSLPQVSVELLKNCSADVRFYFEQACFEKYLQDYNWQQYGDRFEVGEKKQ